MITYRILQALRPQMAHYGKWTAKAVHSRTVSTPEIAQYIERQCCLKRSDILACLAELAEQLIHHLHDGDIVELDGIGRFKLEIDSSPARSPYTLTRDNIRGVHCIFTPIKRHGITPLYSDISYIKR